MNLRPAFTSQGGQGIGSLAVATGLICLPVAFLGPNVMLGVYAALILAIGIALLWRPAEPPILMFIFLYQWTQAAAEIGRAHV